MFGFDPFAAAHEIMGGDDSLWLPTTDADREKDAEIWNAWLELALAAQREPIPQPDPIALLSVSLMSVISFISQLAVAFA